MLGIYKVIRGRNNDLRGTVLLDNIVHVDLTEDVATLAQGYSPSTWENRLPALEASLNNFLTPVPGTNVPIAWVDRNAARLLAKERLEEIEATVTRKSPPGSGYRCIMPTRQQAVSFDTQIHLARSLLDISVDHQHAHMGNPLVRDNYDPAVERQLAAMIRARKGAEADFRSADTGRYFSVHVPTKNPPAVDDPHLYKRINRGMLKYCTSIGVHRGWQMMYDIWSRGDEAFSMPMRSLYLGAVELGEEQFGRVVKIKDKPTGAELVKLAAMSPSFEALFYDQYMDGERKLQDPRGWGRADYEKACWAGDEEALNTPVFYTLNGTGLTADTARYMFGKVVRKAGIKCGERHAWIHLGRHDRIENALAQIEALPISEEQKEQLRMRIVEYIAWASGAKMLKVYGRQYEALRAAARAVEFQIAHDPVGKGIGSAAQVDLTSSDDVLSILFGGR